jgi:hypothetical protein
MSCKELQGVIWGCGGPRGGGCCEDSYELRWGLLGPWRPSGAVGGRERPWEAAEGHMLLLGNKGISEAVWGCEQSWEGGRLQRAHGLWGLRKAKVDLGELGDHVARREP